MTEIQKQELNKLGNVGQIILDLLWGETPEAVGVADSDLDVVLAHLKDVIELSTRSLVKY